MELVWSTRIIGKKRIVVPNKMENYNMSSPFATPSPKRRDRRSNWLESLPQDLLVKILCRVTHGDLKQLLLVSKFVNEATSIAKELHFAYSTPRTKPVFRKNDDLGVEMELDDMRDIPNAPKQCRVAKSRIDFEKLASVTVALFPSFDDCWPNDGLAREI